MTFAGIAIVTDHVAYAMEKGKTMSDLYDLAIGPRSPHKRFHDGTARYCLELEARAFQPMSDSDHLAILRGLEASNTDS